MIVLSVIGLLNLVLLHVPPPRQPPPVSTTRRLHDPEAAPTPLVIDVLAATPCPPRPRDDSASTARKIYGDDRRRPRRPRIDLEINAGKFLTLLGPSGCGKTTTLRMIAGFETPTAGDLLLDDDVIMGMAPNHRPMAMVFQSYALFPHLTVFDNVAYGLKLKKLSRSASARRSRRSSPR